MDRQPIRAGGKDHSFLLVELSARRDSSFYVWKVLLPLVLIVCMSWGVFWIDPALFGPQIGLSSTSMLVLIAFQFSIEGTLPRMGYFTRMDEFVLGSTLLVFLAFTEAIASVFLMGRDRKGIARRLDRVSRWVFATAFGVMAAFVLLR